MATSRSAKAFNSHNPVTGEPVGSFPIYSAKQVSEIVSHARHASTAWVNLGFPGRKKVLLSWSTYIINNIDQIATLVSLETGKPMSDAKLEVSMAVSHIGWAARHAEDVVRVSYRAPGALMANMSASVERSPLGVVGVIGPWNYPIFTPVGSIAYALATGNTVVFKPSEYTPGVGVWLEESFNSVAPFADIFTTITGLAETGNALCLSGVDKLSFTGSTRTAKLVAAACAINLTPIVAECGGKDPVIVASDANVDRAVDATIWSAMANAGQSCIGAERVYVDEKVADSFIAKAVALAGTIHAGAPGDGNYGPATMPSQISVISSHIRAAIKDGGQFAYGSLKSVQAPFVQPIILVDVPESSAAVREETFGPIIIINRVADMEEAIELSNATRYGLGANIWSKRQGKKIASQLHCGMVAINSTFSFAAIPSVPFGGVKDSGYGRVHGPEGLLEYTYPRTVVRTRFNIPLHFLSFKRRAKDDKLVIKATKILKGRLG
ncbi:MAG: aldehyde dehydrogenase family protein [Candidatus Planktophila sp.]|nr:aldehyde dehydrogenase family protein [Candidatus Planktophila sp.]